MRDSPSTVLSSLPARRASPRGFLRWRAAGLFAAALAVIATPVAAPADEPEQMTFEERLIHSLLGGASRPGIDYRERSPLVIPPSLGLPRPGAGTAIQSPEWPQDPDQKRRAAAPSRGLFASDQMDESERPLTPDELRRGTRAGAGRLEGPAPVINEHTIGRPLTPTELKETRSLFGLVGRVVNRNKPEPFTGEPERRMLTEPPPGYRTPSGSQPYAPPGRSRAAPTPTRFDPADGAYR